ncbi:hypothetical protein TWF506_007253 [Arthrobotrys conoides]|uniref:Uncharacterized protein n=1 Tax=Arthrobotrys conoides TaxID=74498 RepID=A0AAN8NJX9_9PEZI
MSEQIKSFSLPINGSADFTLPEVLDKAPVDDSDAPDRGSAMGDYKPSPQINKDWVEKKTAPCGCPRAH